MDPTGLEPVASRYLETYGFKENTLYRVYAKRAIYQLIYRPFRD